jgi:hypothetical protein
MSNLVHNEQVKLVATFWNNLGVAGPSLCRGFYRAGIRATYP